MSNDKKPEMGVQADATARLKTSAIAMKANAQIKAGGRKGEQPTPGTVAENEVKKIIEDWPKVSKTAAEHNMETYGPPNEAMASRLIWYNNGAWKRTLVYRDELLHNFPQPHTDVIENIIDYKVPPEKVGELAKFEGSVVVELVKGEVSARCHTEAANILSLNMMHEIVTGKLSAQEAREKVKEQNMAYVLNDPAPYAERLQFELPKDDTTQPDESAMADSVMTKLKEKMKDFL